MIIRLNKILLDRSMSVWLKTNENNTATGNDFKLLPSQYDKSVGIINARKIENIVDAYESGIKHELPPLQVERYKNTDLFVVNDGRHRTLVAIKYGLKEIACQL